VLRKILWTHYIDHKSSNGSIDPAINQPMNPSIYQSITIITLWYFHIAISFYSNIALMFMEDLPSRNQPCGWKIHDNPAWLVVDLPLKNDGVRQLG